MNEKLLNQKLINIIPIYDKNGKLKKLIGFSFQVKIYNNDYHNLNIFKDLRKEKNYINFIEENIEIKEKLEMIINDLLNNNLNKEIVNIFNNILQECYGDKYKDIFTDEIIEIIIDCLKMKLKYFLNDKLYHEIQDQLEINSIDKEIKYEKIFNNKELKHYDKTELLNNILKDINDIFNNNLKDNIIDICIDKFIDRFFEKFYEIFIYKLKNSNLLKDLIGSIIIFNDYPNLEKSFEIRFIKEDLDYFFKMIYCKREIFNNKLFYLKEYLLLFLYKNAYLINLNSNEIVSIYELNTNLNLKEEDNLFNKIKNKVMNNININIKNDNIIEYNINPSEETFLNFKDNLNLIYEDKNCIIFIDNEESRIIQKLKFKIKIADNIIYIYLENNEVISFNSTINPFIYKLIFPNYIHE